MVTMYFSSESVRRPPDVLLWPVRDSSLDGFHLSINRVIVRGEIADRSKTGRD